MADYLCKAGTTDVSVNVFIFDPATGLADTSVIFSTTGLVMSYRREGAAKVDATAEVTLAALTTAHTDWGFLHIGAGIYRFDLPDAAVATGAKGVQILGTLTSREIVPCYIHLVTFDPYDTVRLGLTALPNVASGSAGAIPTTGTGANQLSVTSGHVTLGDGTLTSGKFAAGAITATVIATDAIDADAIADNAINAAAIAADAITAAKIADGAIDAATFAAGAITPAAIATGAIDADALATDAVTEIQSGLLTMATALPGSPTADTVGKALKNASVALPSSAAGASGGLATFDDVNAGIIFGTVDDGTPAAGAFTVNAGLSSLPDLTGSFLIFTNNGLMARKITLDDEGSPKTLTFTGTPGTDADAPFAAAPTNGDPFIIFGFHGA